MMLLKKFIIHIFHFYFALRYCDNKKQLVRDFIFNNEMIYELRGVKIKTRPRNTRTALVLYEVSIKKVYEQGLKIPTKGTIIDIGASIGEFTVYAAKKYQAKVISIEPEPGNIELLKQNIKINGLTNVDVIEAAVTGKSGKTNLYLSRVSEGNSVYSKNKNEKFRRNIEVRSISLDQVVKSRVDLLKIDAEGAEGEIIANTPEKILRNCLNISMEYHNYSSKYNSVQMMDKLKEVGFEIKDKKAAKYYGYIYACQNVN